MTHNTKPEEGKRIAVSKILGIGSRFGQAKKPITEDEVNFACELLDKYVSPSSTAPQPSTLSVSEVIDAYVDRIEYNHSIQRDVFRIKYDAFESWFKQQGFTITKQA